MENFEYQAFDIKPYFLESKDRIFEALLFHQEMEFKRFLKYVELKLREDICQNN